MENKSTKLDEKNTNKFKDKGDKLNLLFKVLEDLEMTHFIHTRDRGDTRGSFGIRNSQDINIRKPPKRNFGEGKKKTVGISASEVKTRKPEYTLDSDDSSKKHRSKAPKEEKKLEESKAKTMLLTIKDVHKVKPDQKPRAYSEQLIKSMPETENNDTRRDENTRRIDEKVNKLKENTKIGEAARRTDIVKNLRLPPGKDLKFIEKDALERRKLLRQRYTVKLNSSNKNFESKGSFKNDKCKLENEASEIFNTEKLNETPKDILQQLETTKLPKRSKEPIEVQRKPIIKTIRNNDHRVYKAVTFIDQKEATPLQIKMPNSKKSVETNTNKNKSKPIASKVSEQIVKEKSSKKNIKEKRRLRKRPSSPVLTTNQPSPQTEVAKWAPASITQDTKPYYEAWVDTTLAAIAKCSEKNEYNKHHIVRTFKRAFELDSRPYSPHLVYQNVGDEQFMGRITVNKSK